MAAAIDPVRAHRERAERLDAHAVWVRRLAVGVLTAVVVIALLNVVGQRSSTVTVGNAYGDLTVHSPTTVRPGLLFQGKITITAHQAIPNTELRLGSGWFDGLTLNTEEPGASTETSGPGGSVDLSIGSLKPGQTFVQYLAYQVNPTSSSSRHLFVAVRSNGVDLITATRTMTIVP